MKTQSVPVDKLTRYAKDVIDKVKPKAFYKVTIQLGGMRSWGVYSGVRRSIHHRTDGTSFIPAYQPTVCEVKESITGEVLAGLLVEHNDWLDGYKKKEPLFELDYQIAVLQYAETDEVPVSMQKQSAQGMVHVAFIESIVQRVLEQSRLVGSGKA